MLTGYDDESVYLADTNLKKIQKTSMKSFEVARTSRHKPFPPRNYYAIFELPKSLPDLKSVIIKSIRKIAEDMY